jgi:hypothetical protein
MPPVLNGTFTVSSRQFGQVYPGQWGNGPLQTIYTAPLSTQLALIYVQQLTAQNSNSPAYIVNVGSGANYMGGDIHGLPGQIHIEPQHGDQQSSVNVGLLMNPGEALTVQLANQGDLFIQFTIYEFTATLAIPLRAPTGTV